MINYLATTCLPQIIIFPVSWGCKIHQLLLCRRARTPPPNECLGYDTKQSDGEVSVMLELLEMQSTPLLPLLPGPLWPGVVALDKVLSMGQIELNCVLMINWIASNGTFCILNWIVWNRTVFDIEAVLMLNRIVWNRTVLIFSHVGTKTILILNWIVWIRTV